MPETTTTKSPIHYSRDAYSLGFSRSHVDFLLCYSSFSKKVSEAIAGLQFEPDEEQPSTKAISDVIGLLDRVSKTRSLFQPEVSSFGGEIILTWRCRRREISLVSRGRTDDPKMLKYESRNNAPSYSQLIPNVTEDQLARAIHYSLRYPGWLYE